MLLRLYTRTQIRTTVCKLFTILKILTGSGFPFATQRSFTPLELEKRTNVGGIVISFGPTNVSTFWLFSTFEAVNLSTAVAPHEE